MSEGYRRDLELAPGAGFRLRRRPSARVFSVLLAIAAIGWGIFDLSIGYRIVGALTVALAAAFVAQLVQAEVDSWRFDGAQAVHRRLRGLHVEETRVDRRMIRGVEISFVKGSARAALVLRDGGEVPLVEGDPREVQRIADRFSAMIAPRPEVLH